MEFRNVFFIATLSLILFACQERKEAAVISAPVDKGIISGVPVKSMDAAKDSVVMVLGPDMGSLHQSPSDFTTCTGVLVGDNVVLTAAHCVVSLKSKVPLFLHKVLPDLGVVAFASSPQEKRPITRFVVHEKYRGQTWQKLPGGYRPQVNADLALVYFEGSRPANSRVAELQTDGMDIPSVDLYGYGYERFDVAEIAQREADISKGRDFFIQKQSLLMTTKKTQKNAAKDGLLLDQRGSSGICYGDSGGPAFSAHEKRTLLVGIHSHRTGLFADDEGRRAVENIPNDCQYESFVTRVDTYSAWIQRNSQVLARGGMETLPVFQQAAREMREFSPVKLQDVQSSHLRRLREALSAKSHLKRLVFKVNHPQGSWRKDVFAQWLSLNMGWIVARDAWAVQEDMFQEATWSDVAVLMEESSTTNLKVDLVVTARFRSEDFRRESWFFDAETREILVVREIVTGE